MIVGIGNCLWGNGFQNAHVGRPINFAANGMIGNQKSLNLMLTYGEEIIGLDCLVLDGFNQINRGHQERSENVLYEMS